MAHSFWRINITGANLGNNSIGSASVTIAEVVFYDASNNVISTVGGTASVSSEFGAPGNFPAAQAFDGNPNTWWASGPAFGVGVSTGSPEWIQMQFASPVAVDHFSLTSNSLSVGSFPTNFSVQSSDDGATWTTVYSYQGGMRNSATGLYTNTFYTTGVIYRLNVTAVQSGPQAAFSNIKLFDGGGTLITGVLGSGFASSWDGGTMADGPHPTQAYNGTCSSWFTSANTPSSGSPEWIGFQFPPGTATPASLTFQTANHVFGPDKTPIVFSLQSSTDGATFTTLQEFASASWVTTCQTQTFSLSTPTRSISASPAIGTQCQTETVTITGLNTHFVNGTTTVAVSGTGATVSSVAVTSSTSLTFSLALACTAQLGVRTLTVTTGAESDTAPFVVVAGPTIASLLQGNIAWAQVRLGFNGRFGTGMYGASTDGSGLAGDIPAWGGPDGQTLVGSGTSTAFIGGGPISVNGAATVRINGTGVSFDDNVLINGA